MIQSKTLLMVDESYLQNFKEELLAEVKSIVTGLEKKDDEWLDSKQVCQILGICPKTWQTYRDNKFIPFSQFGRKIYVKRSDLVAFMESNKIKAEEVAL